MRQLHCNGGCRGRCKQDNADCKRFVRSNSPLPERLRKTRHPRVVGLRRHHPRGTLVPVPMFVTPVITPIVTVPITPVVTTIGIPLAITRGIFAVIPVVPHKVDPFPAGVIFLTV